MSSRTRGGIGFFGALQILFIGLKLGKVIDWSWWLVMLPLIINLAVVLILIAIYLLSLVWVMRK